jgi:hypothetical protein
MFAPVIGRNDQAFGLIGLGGLTGSGHVGGGGDPVLNIHVRGSRKRMRKRKSRHFETRSVTRYRNGGFETVPQNPIGGIYWLFSEGQHCPLTPP